MALETNGAQEDVRLPIHGSAQQQLIQVSASSSAQHLPERQPLRALELEVDPVSHDGDDAAAALGVAFAPIRLLGAELATNSDSVAMPTKSCKACKLPPKLPYLAKLVAPSAYGRRSNATSTMSTGMC
mmetsp:Transcript_52741/g.125988  ORF Transcript_52741/g.125988 Transcript_52741/m.125988 type:complete len:128 (-) Transcript_52741:251-634(-)